MEQRDWLMNLENHTYETSDKRNFCFEYNFRVCFETIRFQSEAVVFNITLLF